ncbi:MAG TPA: metalloregulator ArsR/SmtB family transcription factor [Acidobacteriaceae bacterium]|nr:metalloregulator ArsR/SmtB family transcription factor [Acidobacteriaceae bacterium]
MSGAVEGARARVFAALGDETRLALVAELCGGGPRSISELTERAGGCGDGRALTRQAVTKHLRVLESAGLVRCGRSGRERRFVFEPRRVEEMRDYLESVSSQWDAALGRLKALVE